MHELLKSFVLKIACLTAYKTQLNFNWANQENFLVKQSTDIKCK